MSSDYSNLMGVRHHHQISGLYAQVPPNGTHLGVADSNVDFHEAYVHGKDERAVKRANLWYMSSDTAARGIDEATNMGTSISRTGVDYMDQDGYIINEGAITGVDGQKLMKGVRRLAYEQVKALEKAFEGDNRLEPERKVKLASNLGLQPRQVAIWFQNRRARWKTKQLENDYSLLKSSFDALKAERDTLLQEKQQLQDQVARLKGGVGESKSTNPHEEHDSVTLLPCSDVLNQERIMKDDQKIEIKASHPRKQDDDNNSTTEGSETNGVIDEPSSVLQVEDSTKHLVNGNDLNNNHHHHWRLPPHQHAYRPSIKNEESWENNEENGGSFNISIDWYW